MHASAKTPATLEDLLSMPEEDSYEIVDGELVQKEAGSGRHGRAQIKTGVAMEPFHRKAGGPPNQPGGWWFSTEALIQFSPTQVRKPDLAGWRRERMPQMPDDAVLSLLPDWICEILSTNRADDLIRKKRLYHQCQIPHYWILDPRDEMLTVHRWAQDGYTEVLAARRGDFVRAEPFDAIELSVGALFGEDD